MKWWCWLLLPLTPLAILIGFIVGFKQKFKDRKIAFYANGEAVTYGECRKWVVNEIHKADWVPKTKQ